MAMEGRMHVNVRVQKHREKLAEQHRQRLEVQMDCGVIDKMSGIARFKKEPMWSAVQAALEAYVEEYDKLTAEGWRLQEEHTRIMGLADSSERRQQIEAYRRHIASYNERLTNFERSPYVSGHVVPAGDQFGHQQS